jgi:hypothetical protein
MTDLNNTLQSVALAFVREVKTPRGKQPDAPLRVNRELVVNIIRTQRYQHRDEIGLILEALEYIQGRLPVHDRAIAVAVLLQRDAVSDFNERVGSKRISVVLPQSGGGLSA